MDSFNNLRQRIPFKNDSDDANEAKILDDQEQEELIQNLRRQNSSSNRNHIVGADIIVSLSSLLHLTYLFSSSKVSPLFKLVPLVNSTPSPTFPLAGLFTFINLLIHLNLIALLHPEHVRSLLDDAQPYAFGLLSYSLCYALTCVAPCLCLFTGQTQWQILTWWLLTPGVVYITQSIHEATVNGDRHIAELEAMRYSAPGA